MVGVARVPGGGCFSAHHRFAHHVPNHNGVVLGRRVHGVGACVLFGGGEVVAGGGGDVAALKKREVSAHLVGGLVPVGGVFRHRGEDDGVHVDRLVVRQRRGDALGRRHRVFLDVLVGHGEGGFALERRHAGDGFVHHAAKCVDVAARVGGFSAGLLGGEVLCGADDGGGLRHGGGGIIQRARDAEVHHLHGTGVGDHDVGRFDVAVDDAGVVAGLQRPGDRQQQFRGALGGQRPFVAHDVAQVHAVDELHHDVGHVHAGGFHGAGVVDRDDVGVV